MDEARRPPSPGDRSGSPAPVDGSRSPALADGSRNPAPADGSVSGFGTGKLVLPSGRVGSLFQGTAASDSFGDAHAVSRITDINVDGVVRVDMSAYQDEATNSRL
jgi:hypothetical protein